MESKVKMKFTEIEFPVVKRVMPSLLSDKITPMSTEETLEGMNLLFKKIEEVFNKKVVVVNGGKMPIKVIIPKKLKK
jgi:hypothetical protein